MPSYEHQQIARVLMQLAKRPQTDGEIADWVHAKPHLHLLKWDARADEIILYGNVDRTVFIHTVMARENEVSPPKHNDLLDWNSNPYTVRASYSYSGGPSGTKEVKYEDSTPGPTRLLKAQHIVFGRERRGIDDDDPTYFELLQEFAHAAELHWRADQQAYCRIDENGDLESVVSITKRSDAESITLITCKREPLEIFIATSGQALVRFYDFIMVKYDEFTSWCGGSRDRTIASQDLFYDQCIHPDGHAYTRGVQILRHSIPKQDLYSLTFETPSRRRGRQYARFITKDLHNGKVIEVSTHPDHTISYFDAGNKDLPFEVLPAFFRPEVLLRYKADRDKYVVDETGRRITCRENWSLRDYDVNEAGQVHAYICDLRSLPYREQLHWHIHNEVPKGTISKRAFENDIKGEWTNHITPLERTLAILRRWSDENWEWCRSPNEDDLLRVNTPIANSRDEWAEAFLELAKVTVERFRPKALKKMLALRSISFENDDRSLALLEKLITENRQEDGREKRLGGLREAQNIRSKVRAHSGGKEAAALSKAALMDNGSYRAHFNEVCSKVADELEEIENCIATSNAI